MADLIREAVLSLGYAGIGLLMVVMAPELVMPLAGFLAGEGALSLPAVVAVGTVGAVTGLTGFYVAGRWMGELRCRRGFVRFGRWLLLKESDFDAILRAFRRRGVALVLFGRFLPSVRTLVSLPAGIVSMPFRRYLVLTTVGTLVWNVVLAGTAFGLGAHHEDLVAVLGTYELAVTIALVVGVAWLVLHRLRRRLLPAYGDGDDAPDAEGERPAPEGTEPSGRPAKDQRSSRWKRRS